MSKKPSKQNLRHNARQAAMQALYQWQFNAPPIEELIQNVLNERASDQLDLKYFKLLVMGIVNAVTEIDTAISPALDRDIKDLNPVELAILRVSTYELLECPDVPYKVVINEGVELAKIFGATQSHKYINAVLDKLSLKFRETEAKK